MAAAGVRQDLLPLMRIPEMDAAKARALFKAGLRDAQASRQPASLLVLHGWLGWPAWKGAYSCSRCLLRDAGVELYLL